MSADVRELLPLYALGILEPDERTAVERAIAGDASLARELSTYQEAAEQLVAPVAPPPAVKARLMASIGQGRFESFAERMGKLFDVTVDKARELLGLTERAASWEPQPVPGIFLVHFDGGPAYAAADCGFIRLEPGAIFPPHKHLGEEATIVLSGHVRDMASNRVLGPGDELVQAEGSEHYLVNEGQEPVVWAARAMNGIAVAGTPVRPHRK
ncbi:MAG: cupin domain-containing protein [Deltaproteobacteria bacterium]|nr:cupin domain-containing protein [Deltaproteobacteria bacterium]